MPKLVDHHVSSVRINLKWSEIFVCAAIGLGPLTIACSCSAQFAQARSPIETSQVLAAMRDGSLPTEGSQIRFAAPVTSTMRTARLTVESVTVIGDREVRMRLACADRAACLPFFATVTYVDAMDAGKFRLDKVTKDAVDQSLESVSKPLAAKVGTTLPVAAESAKDAVILKAGAPATLEIEAERVHVRIEVISLQNGAPGNRVRVSSRDHKQTYVAQVVTPTLLKGDFLQ